MVRAVRPPDPDAPKGPGINDASDRVIIFLGGLRQPHLVNCSPTLVVLWYE